MSETNLYKRVESFATDHFGCHTVKQQIGTKFGKVDVVGLRLPLGDFATTSELIAIEVKEERTTFLSAVGQTRAYAIFAHKCYLAVRKRFKARFTPEEKDIAAQLGIGLIEIRTGECHEVLTSQAFSPQDRYVLQVMNKLDFFICAICGGAYPKQDICDINNTREIDLQAYPGYRGQMRKAILTRKNIRYWLYELARLKRDKRWYIYDRRHICKDCVSIFASLVNNSPPK
jgi:hypothetical protein